MSYSIPTLTTLASAIPAKLLAASSAYRAAKGDAEGAATALLARATWIIDQQHRHAALLGAALAANTVAL